MIVVDGNDGLGKTTLIALLRARGYDVADRGLPTKMTDDPSLRPEEGCEDIYLILDGPVWLSRKRLKKSGRDLNELYHTIEGLTKYRARFRDVARVLPRCNVIDASGSPEDVLELALHALGSFGR